MGEGNHLGPPDRLEGVDVPPFVLHPEVEMSPSRPIVLVATAVVALAPLVVATAASSAAPVTCDGRTATIVGTDGKDVLEGTSGRDVIHALRGFDAIRGRGGNDIICGGSGADTLLGGPGADRLFGARGGYVGDDEGTGTWYGNKLEGGPGRDYLSGGPDHDIDWPDYGSTPDRVSFPDATGPITVRPDGTVSGPGIGTDTLAADFELIVGTRYDDTMATVGVRSDLQGGEGADSLRVTKDLVDITLDGGPGDDRLDGSLGKKWMVLYGGSGEDVLLGSSGNDDADPGTGDDAITMGAGNDNVYGNYSPGLDGVDAVKTGSGNDSVDVSDRAAGSVVALGSGTDTLGSFWDSGAARVDASTGTFQVGAAVVDFTGAEVYAIGGSESDDSDAVTFTGSAAAETVRMGIPYFGAGNFLLGGGDDDVRLNYTSAESIRVGGGAGADTIVGSRTDDELYGGAGVDTIDGLRGVDHCVAEHVTNCES
jgi:Ca2+-binding RTX toxin-like protein